MKKPAGKIAILVVILAMFLGQIPKIVDFLLFEAPVQDQAANENFSGLHTSRSADKSDAAYYDENAGVSTVLPPITVVSDSEPEVSLAVGPATPDEILRVVVLDFSGLMIAVAETPQTRLSVKVKMRTVLGNFGFKSSDSNHQSPSVIPAAFAVVPNFRTTVLEPPNRIAGGKAPQAILSTCKTMILRC